MSQNDLILSHSASDQNPGATRTKLTVLDGATGERLSGLHGAGGNTGAGAMITGLAHPWRQAPDPQRVKVEDYGNDLIVYASAVDGDSGGGGGCGGKENANSDCSSTFSYLYQHWQPHYQIKVFSSHSADGGTVVYDTFQDALKSDHYHREGEEEKAAENSLHLASEAWVNTTERAMEYLEDHPHLWRLYSYFDGRHESDRKVSQ